MTTGKMPVGPTGKMPALLQQLLHYSDDPKICRQVGIGEISKGDGEVAAHAPFCAPAVATEEPAPGHVVADSADGVTAENRFAGLRHRGVTGARDGIGFEAFVNGE